MSPKKNNLTWMLATKTASQYKTVRQFQVKAPEVYAYAVKENILNAICSHMKRRPSSWTHDLVQTEALRHLSLKDFKENAPEAYDYAVNHKILDKLFAHIQYGVFQTKPVSL